MPVVGQRRLMAYAKRSIPTVRYKNVDALVYARNAGNDDGTGVFPPLECCDDLQRGVLRQKGDDYGDQWDVVVRRIRPNLRQTVVVIGKGVRGKKRPFLPLIEPTFKPNTDEDLALFDRATKKNFSMMHVCQPV